MSEVVIRVIRNGPYRVEGPCRIVDADGNEFDLTGKARISLCRCGGSSTKPFCDATHKTSGFDGSCARQEAAAVKQADGNSSPP